MTRLCMRSEQDKYHSSWKSLSLLCFSFLVRSFFCRISDTVLYMWQSSIIDLIPSNILSLYCSVSFIFTRSIYLLICFSLFIIFFFFCLYRGVNNEITSNLFYLSLSSLRSCSFSFLYSNFSWLVCSMSFYKMGVKIKIITLRFFTFCSVCSNLRMRLPIFFSISSFSLILFSFCFLIFSSLCSCNFSDNSLYLVSNTFIFFKYFSSKNALALITLKVVLPPLNSNSVLDLKKSLIFRDKIVIIAKVLALSN